MDVVTSLVVFVGIIFFVLDGLAVGNMFGNFLGLLTGVVCAGVYMLEEIPGIRIFGTAENKCGVISFLLGNAHHYDTGMLLDKLGIAVRTGHHCAQPLMRYLGIEGTVRASFAVYNTIEEVDTFINALKRVNAMLNG